MIVLRMKMEIKMANRQYEHLVKQREDIMYEMIEAAQDRYDELQILLSQVEEEIDEYEVPLEEIEMLRGVNYGGY